ITSAMSGTPFSIVQGTAPAMNNTGSGQYPNQLISQITILGGIGVGHPYFTNTVAGLATTDPRYCAANCAWGVETGNKFGSVGRNTLRGPAFFNTDLGLFRTF